MERTFAIIKPDATSKRYTGRILQRIEEAGFTIRAMKTLRLTQKEAEGFYAVHRERPAGDVMNAMKALASSGRLAVLGTAAA